ncbi:malate dehydrogenase, glyoxysomal-like [Phragmites australis]|uniref:malate dehydrogenase, glyoxysomal-like n=1 Tax=Phragmites australis TaxID=29695 RepID=UPI002D79E201|nr:malate dehydrogenase, glyoxysomal-like [Phragmites australis]
MEQQQQGADAAAAARRMATLASHLRPHPTSQPQELLYSLLTFLLLFFLEEEEVSFLSGSNCRAKGAFKVAILGASGGIGQPLALLMKMNPLVLVLHLYDVVSQLTLAT